MPQDESGASPLTSATSAVAPDPPPAESQGGTTREKRSKMPASSCPSSSLLLVTVGLVLTAPRDNGPGVAAEDVLDGRQLRIMAPANPGGGWDQTAREMQKSLRDVIGRSEVVNVGGAGGTIGLSQFTQLEGDPTQLMVTGAVMVGAIESNDSPVSLTTSCRSPGSPPTRS